MYTGTSWHISVNIEHQRSLLWSWSVIAFKSIQNQKTPKTQQWFTSWSIFFNIGEKMWCKNVKTYSDQDVEREKCHEILQTQKCWKSFVVLSGFSCWISGSLMAHTWYKSCHFIESTRFTFWILTIISKYIATVDTSVTSSHHHSYPMIHRDSTSISIIITCDSKYGYQLQISKQQCIHHLQK